MSLIGKYINILKHSKKDNETICFKINDDVDVISIDLNLLNSSNIFFLNFNDIKYGVINDDNSFIMFRCIDEFKYIDIIEEDYKCALDFLN